MAIKRAEQEDSQSQSGKDSREWLSSWMGLDAERHEVAKQLQRRHQFLERLRERGAELQSLKDSHHRLKIESSLQKLKLQHLQKESEDLQMCLEDEERDIAALRQGSHMLRTQHLTVGNVERRLREDLEPELKKVADIRRRREAVVLGAQAQQQRQEDLLEKQMRAEENRMKLVDDVSEAQNAAAMAREQRVKLSMQRQALELELASVAQQKVLGLPVTKLVERSKPRSNDVSTSVPVKEEPHLPEVTAGDPPTQRWYAPSPLLRTGETSPALVVKGDPLTAHTSDILKAALESGDHSPVDMPHHTPIGQPMEKEKRETRLGPSCAEIDDYPTEIVDQRKRSLSPHWTRFAGHTNKADCVEWAGRLAQFQVQESMIQSAEENFSV